MAITPIQVFNSGNNLASIFAGGTNQLSQALNNAIQIGRDQADRQFQQERDFLREQRAEINLAQRRGELREAGMRADRNYERGVFESDRNFEEGRARFASQQARLDARDIFDRERAAASDAFRERELGLRERSEQRESDALARRDQFNADLSAGPGPVQRGLDFVAGIFGGGPSPAETKALAEARAQAARETGDAQAYRSAVRDAARADMELRRTTGATNGQLSPTEARMQRKELRDLQQSAKKEELDRMKLLVADRNAFRTGQAGLRGGELDTPDDLAKAEAYGKDRLGSEMNFALNRDRASYIAAGGSDLSAAEKAKRGEFWDLVRRYQPGFDSGTSATAPTPGQPATSSSRSTNPVADWINSNSR